MDNKPGNDIRTRVFISYSRKDQEFVRKLHNNLVDRGLDTWVDWEGIPLTADWWQEIEAGIEGSDAFAFVISPDSLSSQVCGDEIQSAVENNKRIVPILYREPEKGGAIHPKISSHNWVFMRNEQELTEHIDEMVQIINTDLDWVKAHTRLLQRANEWQHHGLNNSFLLRGDDLSRAEKWLSEAENTEKDPQPIDLQIDYIHGSRRDAKRRQRLTVGGVIIGLIIAILAIVAVYNAFEANKQTRIAQEQTQIAETEADKAQKAEELAANSLELAVLTNAKRTIEPLVRSYSIDNAITRAGTELNRYEYKVEVPPETIAAEVLLDLALIGDYMTSNWFEGNGVPTEEQTTRMFAIFRKALEETPEIDDGRDLDVALLYTKFCQQIPQLSNHKTVLPACEQAISLADQLENEWLSFQVCHLYPSSGESSKLSSLSDQISKICDEFNQLVNTVTLETPESGIIEPGKSNIWLFEGEAGQTIYIYMKATGSDLDSYLDLYNDDGFWVASDDQSGGNNDALMVYTPEESDYFHIVSRGYDLTTQGVYELLVSTEQPVALENLFEANASSQGEVLVGDVIENTLQAGERQSWTFSGEAGQTVSIFMGSTDGTLDTYLQLIGPDGEFLAEDDDGGGGTDSLISVSLTDSGTYQILAGAFDAAFGEGDYFLELYEDVTAIDSFAGDVLGELEAGTAVSGTIQSGVNDLWSFSGIGGDIINVAMVSEDENLDPFLMLISPDGSIIMEDDDGFGNLNAFFSTELPLSGIYTVVASGLSAYSFGDYQLELTFDSESFSFGEPDPDFFGGYGFADAPATIFAAPNTGSENLTNVQPEEDLFILGRSENGDWLYVEYIGAVVDGFVATNLVNFEGDINALPIIAGETGPVVIEGEAFAVSPVTIFEAPDSDAFALGNMATNDVMIVNGRSENGSWLFITFTDENGTEIEGFVPLTLVEYSGNSDLLPVVQESDNNPPNQNEEEPGDDEEDNPPSASTEDEALTTVTEPVTLFNAASADSEVLINPQVGETVEVIGRSENGSWLLVFYTDASGNSYQGYISANRLDYAGNVDDLPTDDEELFFDEGDEEETVDSEDTEGSSEGSLLEMGALFSDSPVTAVLNPNDEHYWTFEGNADEIVTISMVAIDGDLDTFLILLGPGGEYLLDDDDEYGGTDSLISEFQLPESGTFTILARGYDEFTSGTYELTLFQ